MQFFMGLNYSFNSIQSQILLLDLFFSINKVIALVLREEKQREITFSTSAPNVESIAALTAKPMKTSTFASKPTNFVRRNLCIVIVDAQGIPLISVITFMDFLLASDSKEYNT